MCPLRLILIFLSATIAGFFVLKNLRSQPQFSPPQDLDPVQDQEKEPHPDSHSDSSSSAKVVSAFRSGFWACVDMASGRYLWRTLVSSPAAKPNSTL
ncbi:hypothetical protein RJ641_032674 [Dillenia turbinata]|uniref:Uncharacterized protein n=1 Tax=Dillenia turbinata TaxID=194707 RepID=A0AAN8VPT8_9MAGN